MQGVLSFSCRPHHLGGEVTAGATDGLEEALIGKLAQPHVCQLDDWVLLILIRDENVLQLDVPVADVEGVEILHSRDQLVEVNLGFRLVKPLLLLHQVDERSALRKLHHDVEDVLAVDYFFQLDDVRMVNGPKDLDLVLQLFLRGSLVSREVIVRTLLDDFDGNSLEVGELEGQPDLCSGPCAQHLAEEVPGGQLLRELFLGLLIAEEDKDFLQRSAETDGVVLLQRVGVVLANLVAVDPGPCSQPISYKSFYRNKLFKFRINTNTKLKIRQS